MPLLLVLSFIYSAGILTKVQKKCTLGLYVFYVFCIGTCYREGDKVEGVHENDGIVWLDFMAHLVPQTIPVSTNHSFLYGHIGEGINIVVLLWRSATYILTG